MHTENFQEKLTPRQLTFSQCASSFPLIPSDPGPVNVLHVGSFLPRLPSPVAPQLSGDATPPTPGPLFLPDNSARDGGYPEPIYDTPSLESPPLPAPYKYYGLDVQTPAPQVPQPLGTKNPNIGGEPVALTGEAKKQPKGKKKAEKEDGAGWTAKDYLSLAGVVSEINPYLVPQRRRGPAWEQVTQRLQEIGFRKKMSVPYTQTKMNQLLAWKAGNNEDLVPPGTTAAFSLGGILENIAASKKVSKDKTDAEVTAARKKQEENKIHGEYIRRQSMQASRKTTTTRVKPEPAPPLYPQIPDHVVVSPAPPGATLASVPRPMYTTLPTLNENEDEDILPPTMTLAIARASAQTAAPAPPAEGLSSIGLQRNPSSASAANNLGTFSDEPSAHSAAVDATSGFPPLTTTAPASPIDLTGATPDASSSTIVLDPPSDASDVDSGKLPLKGKGTAQRRVESKRKAESDSSDSESEVDEKPLKKRKKYDTTRRRANARRASSSRESDLLAYMREESERNQARWERQCAQRDRMYDILAQGLLGKSTGAEDGA